MNNYSVYKDFFVNFSNDVHANSKLATALLCFIIVNLIVTLLNIFSQNRLKNKEKKIHSFNLKEKKRIKVLEEIYRQMDNLSNFDNKDKPEDFLNHIKTFEFYVNANKLYISKQAQSIITDYSDYLKNILIDFKKKNYEFEMKVFKDYIKFFNKC